jgi:hypothetical protein
LELLWSLELGVWSFEIPTAGSVAKLEPISSHALTVWPRMNFKSNAVIRILALVWRRMGPARIYFALGFAVVIGLAVIGLFHLASSRPHSSAKTPAS